MMWRYDVQYGPDGQTDYAWVYRGPDMVSTMKLHHAVEIVRTMNGLDLTSEGEATYDHDARLIDAGIEPPQTAPQPVQPDSSVEPHLEVVGHVRRDPNDTIPHEAAFQFSECAPGGFDDEGWRAVGYIDDAQAHIAALTAEVEELTRERDRAEKIAGDYCGSMCQAITEKGWEADRAETAEARVAQLVEALDNNNKNYSELLSTNEKLTCELVDALEEIKQLREFAFN